MRLPDFPWDQLVSYKEKARTHPYGLVDLSVGTPVDSTPAVVQQALAGAADAPGYPLTVGTPDLREAAAGWLARRLGVLVDPGAVLPVLGTKELVAQLPGQLGLEPGDRVWVPTPAYPTYEVGALLARCEPVVGPADGVTLVWLNSPANPTGRVLTVDEMRAVVTWARERGVIVASDECYIELGWEARPVSVLHPDVCGGSHEGLLAVHSLSKRSNLAGYRAGFVTGDPQLVEGLTGVRKHAGFMMPTPVAAAMAAAYADDIHVADQRARYANRRAVLAAALAVAGFTIDHSEAGLYLWATRGEDAWATVDALAGVGVLVAPGTFYGEGGRHHVRVALTAPDSQVATVPERMTMLAPAVVAGGAGSHPTGPAGGGYPQPGPPGGYAAQQGGYAAAAPGYPAGPARVPYESAAGYETRPGYEPRPGEGQPGYDGQPGYEGARGYEGQPRYEGQPTYQGQPDYLGQPDYQGQPTYQGQPDYQGQPNYQGRAGYEGQPGYEGRRGFEGQRGYEGQPGYERAPRHARPSGYGARPGDHDDPARRDGQAGYDHAGDYDSPAGYDRPPGPDDPPTGHGQPSGAGRHAAGGPWNSEPDIR